MLSRQSPLPEGEGKGEGEKLTSQALLPPHPTFGHLLPQGEGKILRLSLIGKKNAPEWGIFRIAGSSKRSVEYPGGEIPFAGVRQNHHYILPGAELSGQLQCANEGCSGRYADQQAGSQLFPQRQEIRERIEAMARYFGLLAGVKYAEPFLQKEVGLVDDLLAIPVQSI